MADRENERVAERETGALKKLQALAGVAEKGTTERLDWMYEQSTAQKTDMELMNTAVGGSADKDIADVKSLQTCTAGSLFLKGSATRTTEDTLRKLREDPLFQIRREEQAARESMMQNPLVMARIKKKMEKGSKKDKKQMKKDAKKMKKAMKKAKKIAKKVDQLADTCEALTGLQHLDLAYNDLDAFAATTLITCLAEQRGALADGAPLRGPRRLDLHFIRFDGCPVGDPHEFRQDVAGLLASRGDQVVAGGELVLYLGVDGVRWFAEPRASTLAARRRDDTLVMAATSFEELLDGAYTRKSMLDTIYREGKDVRTRTLVGREILGKQHDYNEKIITQPLLTMYCDKVAGMEDASPMEVTAGAPPEEVRSEVSLQDQAPQ